MHTPTCGPLGLYKLLSMPLIYWYCCPWWVYTPCTVILQCALCRTCTLTTAEFGTGSFKWFQRTWLSVKPVCRLGERSSFQSFLETKETGLIWFLGGLKIYLVYFFYKVWVVEVNKRSVRFFPWFLSLRKFPKFEFSGSSRCSPPTGFQCKPGPFLPKSSKGCWRRGQQRWRGWDLPLVCMWSGRWLGRHVPSFAVLYTLCIYIYIFFFLCVFLGHAISLQDPVCVQQRKEAHLSNAYICHAGLSNLNPSQFIQMAALWKD